MAVDIFKFCSRILLGVLKGCNKQRVNIKIYFIIGLSNTK
jgi:hypothetical protein